MWRDRPPDDPLRPARGVLRGLGISSVLWAVFLCLLVAFCSPGHARANRVAPLEGRALMSALYEVNHRRNGSIRWVSDRDKYGKLDHWTEATTEGDCEDFALAKRRDLLDMGVAPWRMKLVVYWEPEAGEYHAVLAVEVRHGLSYVLDNRTNALRVAPWRAFVAFRKQGYDAYIPKCVCS